MEQASDRTEAPERYASEQGADFDQKKAAYEAACEKLLALTEMPDKSISIDEYKVQIRKAMLASRRAHKAMMEAWA